jgi:hypothetical protein
MLLQEMYDQMSLYGFDDFEDSNKLLLLNEAYYDICTREPWPFLEKQLNITVPNGQKLVTNNTVVTNTDTNVSTSIGDLDSVLSLIDVSNRVVMVPERLDVIEKNYVVNNLSVFPERYYFINEDMYLYPETRGDTNYILTYLAKPVAIKDTGSDTDSNSFLIPARHHSVLVYGALVKAFLVNDDPQAAAFQNMFEQRYQQMRNNLWLNQYDRTDRIHVLTDSYDWGY